VATNASAQWWVRTDGADTNGGGYDAGISGAGTNYCDQAAAQASWTSELTLTVTTNVLADTSAKFTAAMVGNAVNVPGKGYYWIITYTDANHVVVQLGTGAATSFASQSGKVGGALRNPYALSSGGSVTAPGTTTALVAGNQINVRASGSGSVGSPDYTQTNFATYPAGNSTAGYVSWVAYNGVPYVKGNGLWMYSSNYQKLTGFYLTTSSNSNGGYGIIDGGCQNSVITNCTFDANNLGVCGIGGAQSMKIIGCEFVGNGTPSLSGIIAASYATLIKNCKIHGWGAWGVSENSTIVGVRIENCAIYNNVSGGVSLMTTGIVLSEVSGCTIDHNGGDGIQIATTAAAQWAVLLNNNITNNGGHGINVAGASSTATNDAAIGFADYNNVWTNTSGNYGNLSAGAHDLSVDPGYTSGSGAYTPTNAALIAAAPIGFA
jgi:hypothetical protein